MSALRYSLRAGRFSHSTETACAYFYPAPVAVLNYTKLTYIGIKLPFSVAIRVTYIVSRHLHFATNITFSHLTLRTSVFTVRSHELD